MSARIIEIDNLSSAKKELLSVGADRAGIDLMSPKSFMRVLKLKSLRAPAANILKQEMLSLGGEAAIARGVIDHSVKGSDVLLFGTLKQYYKLIAKLKMHQFGLPLIAAEIEKVLSDYENAPRPMKIGSKIFRFGKRTHIMGILNVTPDSFSDGGKFHNVRDAIAQAEKMMGEGAEIIDVGGESTRPGAEYVSVEEEIKRVLPVIRALAKNRRAVVSVDTRRSAVAREALKAGAHMVNDVSGLRFDKKMAKVVSEYKAPVCIMHMRGTPRTMQEKPAYADLMGEIIGHVEEGLAIAEKAGILLKKIIVDPGIGFGKTVEHNLEILKKLRELKVLGCPILVGSSRKSVIGKVLGLPVAERIEGTAAAAAVAIAHGADFIRVHDVKEMVRVARMADAIVRGRD